MRLHVGMTGYTDGAITVPEEDEPVDITYQTNTDTALQPELTLSLRNIPNGTFTGTLVGGFQMTRGPAGRGPAEPKHVRGH
jgi:hypothetical protein